MSCSINRFSRCFLLLNQKKVFYNGFRSYAMSFWEDDEKAGYCNNPQAPKYNVEFFKDVFRSVGPEMVKYKNELIEQTEMDPVSEFFPKEIYRVLTFKPEDIALWTVSCDRDHGEGFSRVKFKPTSRGTAIFSGELSTEKPKDGRVSNAGYCNICTPALEKAFYRRDYYDWSQYTHLVVKVRGDGRGYMLNLETKGEYDIQWFDMFNYPLFTRGGPYWQITKIPFSKFYFTHKGRIQDKQTRIPQTLISRFGITVMDKINAPFSLELAYVGLEYDPLHTEEFAYEMYETEKWIADT